MKPDGGTDLLYGNEAVARGAWEAGVRVATGYPGTPSTEIIETMAGFEDVYVEWAPNEKVAFEVAMGASIGGARAMACMKHVGVNVAADPYMSSAYMGVNAGLVLVSADDPGMHSSQNEQDNRWYGKFARVPVLEPADSGEARDYTAAAFAVSEAFDTPVILRTVTRISHARSPVLLKPRVEHDPRPYVKDPRKYVIVPAHARLLKPKVLERARRLEEFAETTELNRLEWPAQAERADGRARRGFVTGGMAYSYVREAFPDDPVFKLGLSYPVPPRALREFAARVTTLYVVEELDPFWEGELRSLGLDPVGKQIFPEAGELSVAIVAAAVAAHEAARDLLARLPSGPARMVAATARPAEGLGEDLGATVKARGPDPASAAAEPLPARPPVLCPGCPHRGAFYVLRKLRLTVAGDIGCYTLGVMPPLSSVDTTICMGASIGTAIGLRRSLPPEAASKVVAVIGDSTFVHSGITPLIDAVYNRTDVVVVIMDNQTTAMTGHQGHPASGLNVHHEESPRLSLEGLARACGVERVYTVDPNDLKALETVLREALSPGEGPAVVISRRTCALIDRSLRGREPVRFDPEACIECGACFRLGCPALARAGNRPEIQDGLCVGCDQCVQVCPQGALVSPREATGNERQD